MPASKSVLWTHAEEPEMQDRGLYERILGLPEPWHVIDVELRDEAREVVVQVAQRDSAVLVCPECRASMTAYDHRPRRWRHLDTGQYKTIIEARVPRGRCPSHGVRQIEVPWAEMHSRFTALFEALVIDWLRETSQRAVARRIGLTWAEVHGIMERAVRRGLARRGEEMIEYLGVDEKSFQKEHEYVTVVCDLDKPPRVLAVGDGQGRASLDEFYKGMSEEQRSGIQGSATAVMRRRALARSGKAPTARIRRLISPCRRSRPFVVRIRGQWALGNA